MEPHPEVLLQFLQLHMHRYKAYLKPLFCIEENICFLNWHNTETILFWGGGGIQSCTKLLGRLFSYYIYFKKIKNISM